MCCIISGNKNKYTPFNMNLFNFFSNLYLFLVALVITIGIVMLILFFTLFNREDTATMTYENVKPLDEIESIVNK